MVVSESTARIESEEERKARLIAEKEEAHQSKLKKWWRVYSHKKKHDWCDHEKEDYSEASALRERIETPRIAPPPDFRSRNRKT